MANEDIRSYQPGQIIFEEGSIGDSMFMIRQGSVEIFKTSSDGEVLLTVQNAGEVIGMFTFFNRGRRLASARARSHVQGQVISQAAGQDPMQNLPKWVQVVIRDFSTRIEQVNQQYARALQEKKELLKNVMDHVRISAQISDCFAELGVFKAKKADDGREMILIQEMADLLEACLGYEREEITYILETFKNMGLLKVELEPDRGQEVVSLGAAQRLKWYAEFVRSTRVGKNKRLLQIQVPFRLRKQLFALRDYVQKIGGDLNKTFKSEYKNLNEFQIAYKTKTKIDFEEATLDAGEKLGLLEAKVLPNKFTIAFHPTNLVRTLIAINVIKRLLLGPGAESEKEESEAS